MENKFDVILKNDKHFESYFNEDDEQLDRLKDASKINIFVGANNSGKSRFIRGVLDIKSIHFMPFGKLSKIISNVNNFFTEKSFSAKAILGYRSYISRNISNVEENGYIKLKKITLTRNTDVIKQELTFNREVISFLGNNPAQYFNINNNLTTIERSVTIPNFLDEIETEINKEKEHEKIIFIPTLRTSHSIFENDNEKGFKKISTDVFKQTILKNYLELQKIDENQQKEMQENEDKEERLEIFTGLNLYNEIVNARNNVKEVREKFQKFEDFISKNFFQNKKIDIVAKFDINSKNKGFNDEEIINIYIDGESKNLYELGDGIQALIILLYKIYMAENNSIIFIDEPEINLHPGMQRLFLEQITTNEFIQKKNLIFFISTHSNHFLDLTIDKDNISIFLFNKVVSDGKDSKFVVKNVNHGDNSTLQYLGVSNSSVFLANCSVWVEGISDRNYLKAFLKAYCRANKINYPKEDIEFAFIEYAGSNIDHYNFDEEELEKKINAFSINNKILLISDFDGDYKQNKHDFYNRISEENKNFKYLTTKDYKEIENLLPFKVWEKTLIHFCNKNIVKTDEQKEDVQKSIATALNRRKEKDYKQAYIGKFLKSMQGIVPEINKIWSGDSTPKTLNNKTEVSFKVLEMVEKGELTWNDFKSNRKIVEFTEEILKFIKASNYNN